MRLRCRHSQRSRSARESTERGWEEDESKWDGSQQDDLKEDLGDEDDIDDDTKPEAAERDALDLKAEADQDGYRCPGRLSPGLSSVFTACAVRAGAVCAWCLTRTLPCREESDTTVKHEGLPGADAQDG